MTSKRALRQHAKAEKKANSTPLNPLADFDPDKDECPDCGALLCDELHRPGCPATDPR